MRQASRKFSERSQAVSLLFDASGFTDAVGHQAHQALWSALAFSERVRGIVKREIQQRTSVTARPVTVNCFILEMAASR